MKDKVKNALNMDGGYRHMLDRAIKDEYIVHTIDYVKFKQRLKYFARRRSQIRNMIQNSHDKKLSEDVLNDLLGPKTKFPIRNISSGSINNLNSTPLSPTVEPSPFPPTEINVQTSTEYTQMEDNDNGINDNIHGMIQAACSYSTDIEDLSSHDSSSVLNNNKNKNKQRKTLRYVLRRISVAERNELIIFLDEQIDQALMFYLSQWQKLSNQVEIITHNNNNNNNAVVNEHINNNNNNNQYYEDIGDEILELIAFCVINVVTVQQVLIRYDAFARTFDGTPMMNYYIKKAVKHPTNFRKLLFQQELQAIADSYTDFISTTVSPSSNVNPTTTTTSSTTNDAVEAFTIQREMFDDILDKLQSTEYASKGFLHNHNNHQHQVSCQEALFLSVRKWFYQGLFEDRLGLEPAYLVGRGQSLSNEMERIAMWRKTKNLNSKNRQNQQQRQQGETRKQLSGMQVFHLTLNLLSAFLYCMNYYIVEPSSTMYVNRLGAHDAMSGTLIGMMPLAAFVSSIPYSYWTNRSFRYPFIMSCFLLVTGNVLYSLADQWRDVRIALIGRFLAGLGAPKCIIRRYMADTTPVSLRTGVNAGFGMVVAAGSAMGPAMAIVLNSFEYTFFANKTLGYVTLNGLTLPGYFMAGLWTTFAVIVLMTFEEPDREGLKEQQELEARGAIPFSPSNVSSNNNNNNNNDETMSVFSSASSAVSQPPPDLDAWGADPEKYPQWVVKLRKFADLITLPVRICLGLLFCKVFTIESLVSATSALSKNRYRWKVQQVGTLGLTNGLLVIPFSVLVGRLSMSYQDHVLMKWLVGVGCFGMFLLIDLSDLVMTPTGTYNEGHVLAVSPPRYISGYFLSYLSIQAFEGVIGSTLSKVIPTALASGTFNSGLLATLVDTFGRACGDLFISFVGYISLRQLMNLLFIPGFLILLSCFIIIERSKDMLSV